LRGVPNLNVLVPGAAGPAGINVIKSLKMAKLQGKIIATNTSYLSAGFFLADAYEIMPKISESEYFDKLLRVVRKHSVNVLMPSSSFDIFPYSENKEELLRNGAFPVVSSRKTLEICRDKVRTNEILAGHGELGNILPFTSTSSNKIQSFPVAAKSRYEKGGDEFFVINDEADLRYVESKFDHLIFQELLPGTEYTIDVLCDFDGVPLVAVPRIRIQLRGGVSSQGRVIHNTEMEDICKRIAKIVGILGPCCIQMKESPEGAPKLVEVNARMGGGTMFAALAGVNIPDLIVQMVGGKKVSVPTFKEITVIRYFEEIIVEEELLNSE